MSACIDPIAFESTWPETLIVVEGFITDAEGPYTVEITRGISVDVDRIKSVGVAEAKVTLISDEGDTENFTETSPGVYKTGGAIRGKIGHSYHISLEMPDGAKFESEPEVIRRSGEVKEVRVEFEHRTTIKEFGEFNADVFNIYADGDAIPSTGGEPSFVRWRYAGTYKVETHPERHVTFLQQSAYMTPLPCSGYVVEPALGGGKLVKKTECTCCICYCKNYESEPQISDTNTVKSGQFRNVKVGEIPINPATFFDKFMVEVEQMQISKPAFEFFTIMRNQKLGASNLFQPPPGQLRGNIYSVNGSYPVIGLFWGAAVHKKTIFVLKSDLPYPQPPIDEKTTSCFEAFANASSDKPANWDE